MTSDRPVMTQWLETTAKGEQVVVGDVTPGAEIAYEVLCRRHHMRQVTARASRAGHVSSQPLPFKE